MKERTIYTIMNKVYTLRNCVKTAVIFYKRKNNYYLNLEDQAIASLYTLNNVDYITHDELDELYNQLNHVFKMYKRNIDNINKSDIPFDPPYTIID